MALVTALLIVALATIIATGMAQRMQLDIRRTGNLLSTERGYQYARGLELWAIAALELDAEESLGRDSRTEPWASDLPVVPLDEGQLSGRLIDLDGRFNLNNLVVGGIRKTDQIAAFERLLTAVELDPALARRCVDWIDPDTTAERDGAEDDRYSRRQPPYRAANAPFVALSELRLIDGVSPEVFDRLAPHVTVLPPSPQVTAINLNSATVPVLMSLHTSIGRVLAEAIHQDGQADFDSMSAFWEFPEMRPYERGLRYLQSTGLVGLNSRYFLARGVIEIDQRTRRFQSLIEERDGRFFVLWRRPERFFTGYSVAAPVTG